MRIENFDRWQIVTWKPGWASNQQVEIDKNGTVSGPFLAKWQMKKLLVMKLSRNIYVLQVRSKVKLYVADNHEQHCAETRATSGRSPESFIGPSVGTPLALANRRAHASRRPAAGLF
jgi:hypothetical protein